MCGANCTRRYSLPAFRFIVESLHFEAQARVPFKRVPRDNVSPRTVGLCTSQIKRSPQSTPLLYCVWQTLRTETHARPSQQQYHQVRPSPSNPLAKRPPPPPLPRAEHDSSPERDSSSTMKRSGFTREVVATPGQTQRKICKYKLPTCSVVSPAASGVRRSRTTSFESLEQDTYLFKRENRAGKR